MKSEKLKVNRKNRNEGRPGYKKTRIGWIPEEWGIASLKEVAKLERGRFSARPRNDPRYYGGTIPFVQTGDISSANLYIQAHSQTLNQAGLTVSKIFPKGTILMTIAANIGDVAISKYELACPDSLVGINGNQNVNQLWLFYYLSTQKLNLEVQAPQNAQKNINLEILGPHPIPLPPLFEQKKIAEILSAWDRAIEITNRLITNYELLKKGLMQQLLTGRMRFPKFGPANKRVKAHFYDLPSDWKHSRIVEIAREVSEKNADLINYPVLSCSKYDGFVNSLKYFGKKVYSDDTSNYKLIKQGQFGFPSNHIEEGSIGLLNHVDAGIVSPIYTVFETNPEKVFASYLYALFKTDTYQHIFSVNTSSSVDRRGSLRWKEFSKIRVPLPFLEEQIRIAAVLSTCDREIELLKKKLEKLKEQKKGLMQKLLTGEIRHPEFLKCEERSLKCERNGQYAKIRN